MHLFFMDERILFLSLSDPCLTHVLADGWVSGPGVVAGDEVAEGCWWGGGGGVPVEEAVSSTSGTQSERER